MNKPAAIYARVSSDRQKESHTIGSQTLALVEYAQTFLRRSYPQTSDCGIL
jgi:DNA invertase Pin-like site-specific DNA recombinase